MRSSTLGGGKLNQPAGSVYRDCRKCGAIRIDSQIGLEPTPELYVEHIVAVFAEVWRVLRDDGTCWVNLGDSYASATKGSGGPSEKQLSNAGSRYEMSQRLTHGLKDKDLVGIPWRVAFALQAAGWYLRSDIIWSKCNPMPESVTDRPTKAHEYIFLLSKQERYFFDQDAVREAATYADGHNRFGNKNAEIRCVTKLTGNMRDDADEFSERVGRNIRTIWEIATQPYPEAHFATFPEAIAERCIKAGSSEKGCCSACGKPWERMVHKETVREHGGTREMNKTPLNVIRAGWRNGGAQTETLGWQPGCACNAPSRPCIVLDPFSGAGTTALVADKLGRRGVGLELKPDYCAMAYRRCFDDAPLLAI